MKTSGNQPFFSIICPVYNAELFIEECVNSIINQTYTDWELILVDDGSPDKSLSLCYQFAENNKKIKVYESNHIGPLNARKIGIQRAKGKYLLFTDSDDYFDLNTLEVCFKNLTKFKHPDLLTFGYKNVFSDGTKSNHIDKGYELKYNSLINDFNKVVEYTIFPHSITSLCVKAIKRDIAVDALKYCDTRNLIKARFREDYFMSFFFCANCKSLVMLDKYLYNRRVNYGSTTHNLTREDFIDQYLFSQKVCFYATSKSIFPDENQIKIERILYGYLYLAMKHLAHTKYSTFLGYIRKLRNYNFFYSRFERWEWYYNFKNKIAFKLFQNRSYFKLWCLINLGRF